MKAWQYFWVLFSLALTFPGLAQETDDRASQRWDQQYQQLLKTNRGLQDRIDRGETSRDEVIAWLKWRSERSAESQSAGQSKSQEPADKKRSGSDETISFQHGKVERNYLLHLPDDLPPNAPLVFLLHGYHGKAKSVSRMGMNRLADQHRFAVCYPQGAGDDRKGTPHWNARLKISRVDDIGFLSELAKHLQQTHKLNPDRTFVCGVSNGGYMSYTLVAERPDVFKAAASMIGTMSGETWRKRESIKPVPIMQISGLADRVVPIDGSMSESGGWGGAPHQDEIIEFWKGLNQTKTEEVIKISDRTTGYRYAGADNGHEVWYYTVEGLGHSVPGKRQHGISSIELVWEFFSRY
ncbi:MAG: prolyl oligopeptidase family serine peptidase [Mariniblastus sp.]|nr:prolyl oligopeptidase family serine peptidase [Mariniblastus sp.]